jgi:hypothetical protein
MDAALARAMRKSHGACADFSGPLPPASGETTLSGKKGALPSIAAPARDFRDFKDLGGKAR